MEHPNNDLEIIDPEPEDVQEPDFETRVNKLMAMIAEDGNVRDRMLCEIYIAFTDFEQMTRTMALNGGPMAMIKAMMKGGG